MEKFSLFARRNLSTIACSIVLASFQWLSVPAYAQQASDRGIGYQSVEAAFQALQADPEAVMTPYEGWSVFNQKSENGYFLWSFTPHVHPANPSVIRREIIKSDNQLTISMDALCEAPRDVCDILIEQFEQINQQILAGNSGQ